MLKNLTQMSGTKRKTLKQLKKTICVDSFHERILKKADTSYYKPQTKKLKPSLEIDEADPIVQLLNEIKKMAMFGSVEQDIFHTLVYFNMQSNISDKRICVYCTDCTDIKRRIEPWTNFMKTLDLTNKPDAERKCSDFLEKVLQEFKRQHPDWIVWCTGDSNISLDDCSPQLIVEDQMTSWQFCVDV